MPRAISDDIIIRAIYEKEYNGLILPDQSKHDSPTFYGIVESVGPENKEGLQKGDRIFFVRREGIEIRENEETFLRLRREWVLAVVK
jgi:co-chaperonin GroES (HSP10)